MLMFRRFLLIRVPRFFARSIVPSSIFIPLNTNWRWIRKGIIVRIDVITNRRAVNIKSSNFISAWMRSFEIWKICIIRAIRNDFSFFVYRVEINKWIIENYIISSGCSIYRKVDFWKRMCRNKYRLLHYVVLNIWLKSNSTLWLI